jgi:serine/threonine protein kinase
MRVEAQALGALSHPNIVSVTDFGRTADGRPYYIMPLLRGRTVGQMLRSDGPPPLYETILIVRQVLSALSAAQEIGLVHRDIKPDNIFLSEAQDGRSAVKVLDFGVAKVLSASGKGPRPPAIATAEGAMVGNVRIESEVGARPLHDTDGAAPPVANATVPHAAPIEADPADSPTTRGCRTATYCPRIGSMAARNSCLPSSCSCSTTSRPSSTTSRSWARRSDKRCTRCT